MSGLLFRLAQVGAGNGPPVAESAGDAAADVLHARDGRRASVNSFLAASCPPRSKAAETFSDIHAGAGSGSQCCALKFAGPCRYNPQMWNLMSGWEHVVRGNGTRELPRRLGVCRSVLHFQREAFE
eukprot:4425586-Alexandrium_andersonii.AAC.1